MPDPDCTAEIVTHLLVPYFVPEHKSVLTHTHKELEPDSDLYQLLQKYSE